MRWLHAVVLVMLAAHASAHSTLDRVRVTMQPGSAELVFRRTLFSDEHEWTGSLRLPWDGVAVGLRIQLEGGWLSAAPAERYAAAFRYAELTAPGAELEPKTVSLLEADRNDLWLRLFPMNLRGRTIEYTVLAPTSYEGGRHVLALPECPTDLEIETPLGGRVLVGGEAPSDPWVCADDSEQPMIELEPKNAPRVGGALAMVPLPGGRALMRLRIETAAAIADAPRRAHVVVLIDGSRSFSSEQRSAAVAAAKKYLELLPAGRATVFAFDRRVHAIVGDFVAAAEAVDALDAAAVVPRNGSEVALALRAATEQLAAVPAPRRILLLTDGLTREALVSDALRDALADAQAIAHIALVEAGRPSLARDDGHAWTDAARSTGGVVWRLTSSEDHAAQLTEVLMELTRPVRLHDLRVTAGQLDRTALELPEVIDEGEGASAIARVDGALDRVVIEGRLWNAPIKLALRPDRAESERWAALALATPLLDDAEVAELSSRTGAVSLTSSLLAVEPGAAPARGGATSIELGSIGTVSGPCGGSLPDDLGWSDVGPKHLASRYLEESLRRALAACGGGAMSARLALETTLTEVVDVSIDGGQELAACLEQAAWDLSLPSWFTDRWARWTVTL